MDLELRAVSLRGQLAKEAEKLLIEVRQHRMSLDFALERLEVVAATEMKQFAKEFSLADCDLCHWGLKSAMADFLSAVRGPLQLRPAVSDSKAFEFRPWAPDDAEIYTELLGNERVWRYLPEPFPSDFTTETARTLIEFGAFSFHHEAVAIEVERRQIGQNLLRFDGPSDGVRRPIGQCVLRFDRPFAGVRASEVAYWLGEEHWGQGWMSRVLPEFTYRSFRRHSIDVIYAWIMEDNKASIRVAERAGYRREPFVLETQIAESLRRPGFIRYATYRVDWLLNAAEES
jgi:RimJ/RimL family protein N-acetyltransferase